MNFQEQSWHSSAPLLLTNQTRYSVCDVWSPPVSGYCSVYWIPVYSQSWGTPPFYTTRHSRQHKTLVRSLYPPPSWSLTGCPGPQEGAGPPHLLTAAWRWGWPAEFWCVTLHTFIDPQAEEAPSAVESQLEDTASTGPSRAQSQPGQSSVLTTNTLTSYSQPQWPGPASTSRQSSPVLTVLSGQLEAWGQVHVCVQTEEHKSESWVEAEASEATIPVDLLHYRGLAAVKDRQQHRTISQSSPLHQPGGQRELSQFMGKSEMQRFPSNY